MRNGWKPTKKYWAGYNALYGKADPQVEMAIPLGKNLTKKKPVRRNLEDFEQIKFNLWFDKFLWQKGYRWFHCPNGGHRSAVVGAKFKRMGVKAGILDIIIPMARSSYHGLVIELKRVDGKLSDVSDSQNDWINWFKNQQWRVEVAFGFEHAKAIVLQYFSL